MWEVTYDMTMLGEGAYGQVFRGKLINKKTGTVTEVAVKRHEMIRVDRDRTLVEMRLDHPNVVKLLHCEDVKGPSGDIFRYITKQILQITILTALLIFLNVQMQ